jgi:ribonucleoside-diphosphate reductase alpha chain
MDSFATSVSLALQYGVPLKVLCDKFSHTRFEPSGWSGNPEIGYAKSLMDYIFRWLTIKFLPNDTRPVEGASLTGAGAHEAAEVAQGALESNQPTLVGVAHDGDAPACRECGAIMVRNGSCYRCMNCGSTSGCS